MAAGEVYSAAFDPVLTMVPNWLLPPATPPTLQSTAVLLVPVTVAVKGVCWPPMFSDTDDGETATPIVTVAVAVAILVVSAWAIAVIVTIAGEGMLSGAV